LFDAEKYVPLFLCGDGIQKGRRLDFPASIMDITPTISFLLGVRYPASCQGRVIAEAFEAPEATEHALSRAAGR
jgi:arylsulfatase A-like enzyme